jgi:hypothetical protein
MIKKTALIKLILASCLLSSVLCAASIALTAPASATTCTNTAHIIINVRASTGTTDYPACIDPTNALYTAEKGCGAYVTEGATLTSLSTTPQTATKLTCDAGARLESAASGCATGFTKIKILPSGTSTIGDACVKNTNPSYVASLPNGCGYYTVDAGAVSTALPFNSLTFTCTGVGILDASSGCGSGYTKIKVSTSTKSASAFGCVSVVNSQYAGASPTASACGFFKVAASVLVSSFPIVSTTLACDGVQVTAVGSGCDSST